LCHAVRHLPRCVPQRDRGEHREAEGPDTSWTAAFWIPANMKPEATDSARSAGSAWLA
jgi:hypothetical protein